jgi:hypothetical protein
MSSIDLLGSFRGLFESVLCARIHMYVVEAVIK